MYQDSIISSSVIKTDIISYHLWPNSPLLKFCNQNYENVVSKVGDHS